jgi:hypothetical protein
MSNTQNDSRREYVRKLKDLSLDDPEFDTKFNQINKSFDISRSSSNHRDNVDNLHSRHNHMRDLSLPFDLNPFRSLSRVHNHLYNMMNKRFIQDINDDSRDDNIFYNKGEFDEKKLDNLDLNTYQNTDNNTNNLYKKPNYYKYVSSMTTYDNNGIRKAKSISRTEKYDGQHKTVKQVSKFQDGDKYIEEYLNPDGTTRRIEKKINNTNMIEN